MKTKQRLILLILALLAVMYFVLVQPVSRNTPQSRAVDISGFLSGQQHEGFTRARPGTKPEFPADHGAHEDYRHEWWYFTGNLKDGEGRRFGFQLTFFRLALAARQSPRESAWQADHLWMAHFAISDPEANRFFAEQDYARGALDLAGAVADPFSVWVNNWSVGDGQQQLAGTAPDDRIPGGGLNLDLAARGENMALELRLVSNEPAVLHGDSGYSVKNHSGSNASWYYSYPDLSASGKLRIGEREWRVDGLAWMDHEWSSSPLDKSQNGWDWFGLRFSNGDHLMIFQVRQTDGRHYRYGLWMKPDGETVQLTGDWSMSPESTWKNERGVEYPVIWRIRAPAHGIDLSVEAQMSEQWLDLDFSYWEGAVDVRGSLQRQKVSGEGYMELTGY